MYDLILRGGTLFDGSGDERRADRGAGGIRAPRIASPRRIPRSTRRSGRAPNLHHGALAAGGDDTPSPPASSSLHPHSIGSGRTFQISSPYCRIVRSDEKNPHRAVLRIDLRVQASRSRYAAAARSLAAT